MNRGVGTCVTGRVAQRFGVTSLLLTVPLVVAMGFVALASARAGFLAHQGCAWRVVLWFFRTRAVPPETKITQIQIIQQFPLDASRPGDRKCAGTATGPQLLEHRP
jgi:hypothetical protein